MAPINGSLLEFHSNYSPVFYHFRDKAVYSSKIAIFYTLRALDAPSRGSGPNITMSAVASPAMGHWGTCPPGACASCNFYLARL